MNKELDIKDILVEGKITGKDNFILSENATKNKIVIAGLFLPKDKISRNNVLYEWESIEDKYEKLIGLPLLYNHLNEGKEKPVGHFTDSELLTERPDDQNKWQEVWDKAAEEHEEEMPGWYYEADVNPSSEYADSILRGDAKKVSIQAIAKKAVDDKTEEGKTFTRAWIGDILEGSVVPTPGFMETSMEVLVAESLQKQQLREDVDVYDDFPMEEFHQTLETMLQVVPEPFKAARLALEAIEDEYSELFTASEEDLNELINF